MSEGKFLARATSYSFGLAKTGTPGCAVMFKVTEGEQAGESFSWSGWFSEKAAARSIESLQYMGWKGEDPQTVDISEIGEEVEIVVKVETFTNDAGREITGPKVAFVNKNRAGAVKLAAMPASDAQAFREKMKGLVLATRAKQPVSKEEAGSFNHGANQQQMTGTGGKRAF